MRLILLVCITATITEYYLTRRIFNPTTILGWPFVVVIGINKIFGNKLGFYEISSKTIFYITTGIFAFFIGSIFSIIIKKCINRNKYKNINKKNQILIDYKINKIYNYSMIIIIINFGRLFVFWNRYGLRNFIINDGMESILLTGIFSHFLLTLYPLIPILTSYGLRNKLYKYFLPLILISILMFFTFTKYHLISLALIVIIYLNIENPKLLSKTIPVIVLIPIGIFILNYLTNFRARGIVAEENYILNHLFNYISGGLIYDSVNPGITYNNYGIVEIILTMIMVIPNLFTNALFGVKFYPFEVLPFSSMGWNGERGNVLNTISFLFSSGNILGTLILMVLLGVLIGFIHSQRKIQYPFMATVYTFLFLSFYATFLVLAPPWEMIIFSVIIPRIFVEKRVIIYEEK